MPRLKAYSDNSAFTLLELLVSSAIIGLMMMVLLTAASTSLGVWRGAENRISVDREGRNGLALMADDLANVIVLPASAPQPKFGHWEHYVFMEFPVLRPRDYQDSGTANGGDICYVRYKYNSDEKKVSRSHVDSAATFTALRANAAPGETTYEMLATNVTDFNINTYAADGTRTTVQSDIATVSISMGVAERQEVENLRSGVSLPESKTTKQYFSVNFAVPRPQ